MYNSIRINDADELMPPPFILSAKKAAELTGLCYATVIRHCKGRHDQRIQKRP